MTNGHDLKVRKRNGSLTPLNLDKVHKMVEEACDGLGGGVSASQVEMNSGLQFYDGIETKAIQEILIRSASDLISLDTPNYQFVAARLLLYSVYKQSPKMRLLWLLLELHRIRRRSSQKPQVPSAPLPFLI